MDRDLSRTDQTTEHAASAEVVAEAIEQWRQRRATDLLIVSGSDARSYLQSQLSQDIAPMVAGELRWSFVLSPTGKIDGLVDVECVADDRFLLRIDVGFGEYLLTRLLRFKIRVDATIELAAGTPPTDDDGPQAATLEACRIDATWPKMGNEIEPGVTIPAETGITSVAVSFTKGCYPGQELVERMDSRGAAPPRSLRTVAVDEGAAVGASLVVDGVAVGTITSVVGARALALVKRGALEGGEG